MSNERAAPTAGQLGPTSYLILGLVAREGPSTPYDLKRHVAATIGHFWSFPHVLLYQEPPRLAALGFLTEEREQDGRRRRLFTITDAGRAELRRWLARPSREPTQLRDPGVLQLFFADLGSADHRRELAIAQLEVHRSKIAQYEEDQRAERGTNGSDPVPRTVEHWRGVTLPMGLLYERAAIAFWEGVSAEARIDGDRTSATQGPATGRAAESNSAGMCHSRGSTAASPTYLPRGRCRTRGG
jgi:PadR family transcriptional regulator, regulatory protein AphA